MGQGKNIGRFQPNNDFLSINNLALSGISVIILGKLSPEKRKIWT
jgi:hypothetical protein